MCKQKLLRTFSLHMVPKGVPPLETATATPLRLRPPGAQVLADSPDRSNPFPLVSSLQEDSGEN